ncbi:MAG TPA: TetR/AcrR family transcriptional regulator [Ktedonobacteraceae bacterium]|jgi:AcrR family transcriptional regulator
MALSESEKKSSRGRSLILQSALQLFSERGYDSTSIDDIRQAAGFKSKASLYTHFKSKEEIASALLKDIMEEEDRMLMEAYAAAKPQPLHQLVAMGKALIEWGLSHPQEYAFCFVRVQQEMLIQGQPATSIVRSLRSDSAEDRLQASDLLWLNLIHELRRDYPVRQIADAALLSMIMSLISRTMIDRTAFGAISLESRVQQIREVCVSVLFTEPVPFPI